MKKKKIFLCAINNIASGGCSEDCKFCSQSARYRAKIETYRLKNENIVIKEAKEAKRFGVSGYCLVSSGRSLDDDKTEYLARISHAIKSEIDDIKLIACTGTAEKENLLYLKQNGVDSYNHNLETSRNYYKNICTTHSWDERLDTCEAVKSSGLSLCCGGIFGLGESHDDRMDILESLSELEPESIPINFYIPNPSLPIGKSTINKKEALSLIENFAKKLSSTSIIMVAGGREMLFGKELDGIFLSGANAIVLGNYLTTSGESPMSDLINIKKLGYSIAGNCNEQ